MTVHVHAKMATHGRTPLSSISMATNPKPNSHPLQAMHNQQQLEREIRSVISTLTGQLTKLSRPATGVDDHDDDGSGMRIVSLAGTNKGATMEGAEMDDAHGVVHSDDGRLSALANSSYQAVNNSILLGGSCIVEDPGVHLVITEYADSGADQEKAAAKKDSEPEKEVVVEKEKKETEEVKKDVEGGKREQPGEGGGTLRRSRGSEGGGV